MRLLRSEKTKPGAPRPEVSSSAAGRNYSRSSWRSLPRILCALLLLAGWLPCVAQSDAQRSLELVPSSARESTVVLPKDDAYEITSRGFHSSISAGVPDDIAADQGLRTRLDAYLHTAYAEEIGSVLVGDSTVQIRGRLKEDATGLYLAEVPLYEDVTDLSSFDFVTALVPGEHRFDVSLTRFRTLPDGRYDRLLSKWVLVRKKTEGYQLVSHARYADEIEPKWNLPDEEPKCKKGLDGVSLRQQLLDLDDAGVCSITVDISLGFFT